MNNDYAAEIWEKINDLWKTGSDVDCENAAHELKNNIYTLLEAGYPAQEMFEILFMGLEETKDLLEYYETLTSHGAKIDIRRMSLEVNTEEDVKKLLGYGIPAEDILEYRVYDVDNDDLEDDKKKREEFAKICCLLVDEGHIEEEVIEAISNLVYEVWEEFLDNPENYGIDPDDYEDEVTELWYNRVKELFDPSYYGPGFFQDLPKGVRPAAAFRRLDLDMIGQMFDAFLSSYLETEGLGIDFEEEIKRKVEEYDKGELPESIQMFLDGE